VVERCEKEGYVPFKNFVGKYVDTSVAKERFSSMKKFYEKYGHFWVSNGPYYLEKVDVVAHTALLRNSKFLK
jgi:peptide/nickel transport system substrate-binding protein